MVSKAAERSRRQKLDTFCESVALIRCGEEQFQWSGADVSRLVAIK